MTALTTIGHNLSAGYDADGNLVIECATAGRYDRVVVHPSDIADLLHAIAAGGHVTPREAMPSGELAAPDDPASLLRAAIAKAAPRAHCDPAGLLTLATALKTLEGL